MLAQIEAITNRTEIIIEESLIAASQHRLSFVQPFLEDLRNNVAPEKIEAPEDLTEVNLGRIVEEELERLYERGYPLNDEEGQAHPQDAVPVDSEQIQGSEEDVSSELSPKQHPRKQAGEVIEQLALVQARLESRRQKISLYEAFKACGYTRSKMEYFLIEMRGSSRQEGD
jgi:hypothetical protein